MKLNKLANEDLRKWFGKGGAGSSSGGGWDRYNSKGKKVGKCGDSKEGSAYAACLSKEKAAKLGPDGRASFVNRKRAAQSKAGDTKKGGEQSKGQKPTFVKTKANESVNEEKVYIDYLNKAKGFKQDRIKFTSYEAAVKWAKKNFDKFSPDMIKYESIQNKNMASKLTVEQKMELFLEKNVPTDPAKWAASKAAAKRKFDVYPSAYANGWAAKNYKGKGGTWKTEK